MSKEAKISGDKHKENKEESTGSLNSHKKMGDKKKKKMKKVVYYEIDSSDTQPRNLRCQVNIFKAPRA